MAPAREEPTIDRDVDNDHHTGERELDFSCEARRIDHVHKIVLDEALRVAGLARFDAKVVLQVREWAVSTSEFDRKTPSGCWKMDKGDPTPPQRHCGTQKGEQDERQMEQEDAVGSQAERHDATLTLSDV